MAETYGLQAPFWDLVRHALNAVSSVQSPQATNSQSNSFWMALPQATFLPTSAKQEPMLIVTRLPPDVGSGGQVLPAESATTHLPQVSGIDFWMWSMNCAFVDVGLSVRNLLNSSSCVCEHAPGWSGVGGAQGRSAAATGSLEGQVVAPSVVSSSSPTGAFASVLPASLTTTGPESVSVATTVVVLEQPAAAMLITRPDRPVTLASAKNFFTIASPPNSHRDAAPGARKLRKNFRSDSLRNQNPRTCVVSEPESARTLPIGNKLVKRSYSAMTIISE